MLNAKKGRNIFNYFSFFFFFFFQKIGFDIHANCLLWRCQSIFSGEKKRNISLSSAEFSQRAHIPYLTLWDKISQKLAYLEGNSHKNSNLTEFFWSFYNRVYEEIKINQMLLWCSQANYMKKTNNNFRLYWGSSEVMLKKISQNFIKFPIRFCIISQLLAHSLWNLWGSGNG